MKMTTLFTEGYKEKAKDDNFRKFNQRCRRFGDEMTHKELMENGVTNQEIKEEADAGLIKYVPNCGITRRMSGYSLTLEGIKKVYSQIKRG